MPILLKLHISFGNGLKMCTWFGFNPQISFCHFFHKLNLVIFQALSLSKCRIACEDSFSYNFTFFMIPHLGGGHKFSEFDSYH